MPAFKIFRFCCNKALTLVIRRMGHESFLGRLGSTPCRLDKCAVQKKKNKKSVLAAGIQLG